VTPLRIAYVTRARIPSGEANAIQMLKMTAALGALGHEVHLLTPRHPAAARSEPELAAFRARHSLPNTFALRYLPFLSIAGRLRGSFVLVAALAARRLGVDLVYCRDVRTARLFARLGFRLIVETHAPPSDARAVRASRYLAASPCLRRWVFVSAKAMALNAEKLALPEGRCLVAHDAVDFERFEPPMSADEARQRTGIPGGRPVVMHCGHLYPGRADLLLEAARSIPEALFAFIGGTPGDVARLRGLASDLENVFFSGHRPVSEVPQYVFAADVLAIAYSSWTVVADRRKIPVVEFASPMKVFEYLAAGRAIVAAAWPGIAETLVHERNALLFEPDNASALVSTIRRLLDDTALRARLGATARAEAAAHTWSARAERILAGVCPPRA
jgi:glycosyltransferase involved in cell wall biosynthesis